MTSSYWKSALSVAPLCAAAAFLFFTDPIFLPEITDVWWFAGMQIRDFPSIYRVIAAAAPLLLLLLPEHVYTALKTILWNWWQTIQRPFSHPVAAWPALFLLLWIFRTSTLIIGDAGFFITDVIPREANSDRGVLISYDSVGVSWLYSRGYRFADQWFHLHALTWYQAVGTVTLFLFLVCAWNLRHRGWLLLSPAVFAMLFTANWSQATLGAPEHYGQVLLVMIVFLITGVEALRGRLPLWAPALAYSVGAFFHLLVAWLFPALLFILFKRWRDASPDERQTALASMLFPAFATGLLAYAYGFDLSFLSQSNAAEGKLIPFLSPDHPYSGENFKYHTFDLRHLVHIAQEILLMGWPGVLALTAMAHTMEWRRLQRDSAFWFLVIAFGGAVLHNLLWNPDLGFWRDQDLFSISGLTVTVLAAYLLLGPPSERMDPLLRERILAAAIVGGILWRLPVMIWHSMMSPNYLDPTLEFIALPF